jgi:hypothetical protein
MSNIKLNLTIEETNLVLEALGNLPFVRVFELVNKIQAQAQQQFNQNGEAREEEGKLVK